MMRVSASRNCVRSALMRAESAVMTSGSLNVTVPFCMPAAGASSAKATTRVSPAVFRFIMSGLLRSGHFVDKQHARRRRLPARGLGAVTGELPGDLVGVVRDIDRQHELHFFRELVLRGVERHA